jgi:type VI secretion system protein ImpL
MLNLLAENATILILLGLFVLAAILLGLVFWAAARRPTGEENAAAKTRSISVSSLRHSFRRAVELFELNISKRSERYNFTWSLILNEGSISHELPLQLSGLPTALSGDATVKASAHGVSWSFFEAGVAIQLQSSLLGSEEEGGDSVGKVWEELLGLCVAYRPDRPFDSLVVSIPAALLANSDPLAKAELVERAKILSRRLSHAQNQLALQFPIYLVISQCEELAGFAKFSSRLPERLRSTMFGWSSPFELNTPFQEKWVDLAIAEMTGVCSEVCAELSCLELPGEDSSDYFLVPSEIEGLKPGLTSFLTELMRVSSFHESFLLRGIYLTGDSSPDAQLLSSEPIRTDETDANASLSAVDQNKGNDEPSLGPSVPIGVEDLAVRPAFLREIFENKIFLEAGLVEGSIRRKFRPTLSLAARWSAAGIATVWMLAIALFSVNLNRNVAAIAGILEEINRSENNAAAAGPGQVVDYQAQRELAVRTLKLAERIDLTLADYGQRLWAAVIPGSWPILEPLHGRIEQRLKVAFTEHLIGNARRTAIARVAHLTGVPVDPSTGGLIQGTDCSLPAGWMETNGNAGSKALNIEDLPEFLSTLKFLAEIEQIESAISAFNRLVAGSVSPSDDDVALVVKTFFGVDTVDRAGKIALLFRTQKDHTSIPLDTLRTPIGCSFAGANNALMTRLFERNPLLAAEVRVGDALKHVNEVSGRGVDWMTQKQAWEEVLRALKEEESFLGLGKGEWLASDDFQLGVAYSEMFNRAGALGLIEKSKLAEIKRSNTDQFLEFSLSWQTAIASHTATSNPSAPGLMWSVKDKRWSLSSDRVLLIESLTALFGTLSDPSAGKFPDLQVGEFLSWERAKLERAIAVQDRYKKLQLDVLSKVPSAYSEKLERLAALAIARETTDLVLQAMNVHAAWEHPQPLSESDRARYGRIRTFLADLGVKPEADAFATLIRADAINRIRRLDDEFSKHEIFAPRDRDFATWQGNKAPMLAAFGVTDSGALSSYVIQQISIVDSAVKEIEPLIQLATAMQVGGSPATSLFNRWASIVADYGRYKSKSPLSSLGALEQYVLTSAGDLDWTNCHQSPAGKIGARKPGDFFAERLFVLQNGIAGRCRDLRPLLVTDAQRKLRALDDSFSRLDLFAPRDREFQNWNGSKGPIFDAYGVGDPAAMAGYFSQQISLIDNAVREAEPLLRQVELVLAENGSGKASAPADSSGTVKLSQRWGTITNELALYRAKSPLSVLSAMEQFLVTSGTDLDGTNCIERTTVRPVLKSGADVFSERLYSLRLAVATRCRILKKTEAQENWKRFSEYFNLNLAGRPPFGPVDKKPAEVDDIGSAIKLFERANGLLSDKTNADLVQAAGPSLRRFSESMDRAKKFLVPLVSSEDSAASGYDVAIEFRANPTAELEGNKIIDWSFTLGNQTISLRDGPKVLRWEPGMPTVVRFRVARDGPVAPKVDPSQTLMEVEEKTVSFRFSDSWSLLSLIASQRDAGIGARGDSRTAVLKFEFPLVTPISQPQNPKDSQARVFLRLTVTPTGKRTTLVWPIEFPTVAPQWGVQ